MEGTRVCFVIPYPPNTAPSQRFRFEQYMERLADQGVDASMSPLFSHNAFTSIFRTGSLIAKITALAQSYVKRIRLLFQLRPYSYVFLHREALPLGPPVFEWFITKVLRKKLIYDFDDAIWLTDRTNESAILRWLRWRSKVSSVCRWSYKVSCGNAYLADYARQFNPNVVINPTTIDTRIHRPIPKTPTEKVTIGWTGSHSTLKYLSTLIPVLQQLEDQFEQIHFLVIADRDPQLPLRRCQFVPWDNAREIHDLARIDIGVMPLPDDPWTRGKCGFKALQYMALEIPAVVSPVGVNKEIVADGVDGYWCTTHAEWADRLSTLIVNADQRRSMGARGRQKVIEHYSVDANTSNFLSLFQ